MTEPFSTLQDQSVGEIAAQLPGASGVFRRYDIDFCCHGEVKLAEAASKRNLDLGELNAALNALDPGATPDAPQETEALIEHIQLRYHNVHRVQIPELIQLSAKVETVHAAHPKAPKGLADALRAIWGIWRCI